MSLRGAVKLMGLVAAVVFVAIILPANAAMPAYRGISYPDTYWARLGYTDTVTGKVIASSNASIGIAGAYVAIVNASNVSVEYCNTTSDANGSYSFINVSATYYQTPDPYTDPQYMIYAYKEGYGESYSTSFGIDVASITEPVVMWAVLPVNMTQTQNSAIASITPTATIQPSPSPMPSPVADTPSPETGGWSHRTIAIVAAVIILVLGGAGAYLYIRRR